MSKSYQKVRYLTFTFLIVLVDQVSKFYAPQIVPIVHNKGLILGLLPDYSLYLFLIGFFGLLLFLKKEIKLATLLLLGGAVSNLIDRLRFGYVIDYIDLKGLPVFNLADLFIVLGAILLSFDLGKEKRKEV